jgi:hypothetical protein
MLRQAKKARAELGTVIQRGKTFISTNGRGRRITQLMKNRMLVSGDRPEGSYFTARQALKRAVSFRYKFAA